MIPSTLVYARVPFCHFGWPKKGKLARVNGTYIVGEYRATPTDPWHEVANGELPEKGPPTVGFHAGYAPKKELNRWASFSHFKIAELAKELASGGGCRQGRSV